MAVCRNAHRLCADDGLFAPGTSEPCQTRATSCRQKRCGGREHLCEPDAVRAEVAGWAYSAGGKENVDAAPGAEVEDRFAGLKIDECGRIAAAERSERSFFGDQALFAFAVEVGGDGVAAAEGGVATCLDVLFSATARAALPYFCLTSSFIRFLFGASQTCLGLPSYALTRIYLWRSQFV